jgi:hypothetical protein
VTLGELNPEGVLKKWPMAGWAATVAFAATWLNFRAESPQPFVILVFLAHARKSRMRGPFDDARDRLIL